MALKMDLCIMLSQHINFKNGHKQEPNGGMALMSVFSKDPSSKNSSLSGLLGLSLSH